jgi:hypothetical protein
MNPGYIVVQLSSRRWAVLPLQQESGRETSQMVAIYSMSKSLVRFKTEHAAIKACRSLNRSKM